MAVKTAVAVGVLPTTGTVDLTVTGFGTVDAAIVIVSDANTTNNPQNDARFSIGFYHYNGGSPVQHCIGYGSTDAAADSASGRYHDTGAVVRILSYSAGETLIARYTASNTTNGITLTFDSGSTSSARYVSAILIGGTSGVKLDTLNLGTTSGSAQDYTGVGFKPDIVFTLGCGVGSAGSANAHGILSFGAAHNNSSDTVSQGSLTIWSQDNVPTSNTGTYTSDTYVSTQTFGNATAWGTSFSAFDANGFSFTNSANPVSDIISYLAIKLDNPDDAWVDIVEASISIGDVGYSIPTHRPNTLGLVSSIGINLDSQQVHGTFSFGVADDTTQRALLMIDEDALADTNAESQADLSNILYLDTYNGAVDAIASLVTRKPRGFTLGYTDFANSARKMLAFSFGDSTAVNYPTARATPDGWLQAPSTSVTRATPRGWVQQTALPSGTGDITGTLSVTLGGVTVASGGTLDIVGSASNTLGAVSLSSTASLDIVGTASSTLGDVTVASTGTIPALGTLAVTLGDVTLSSAGTLTITGSVSETLADITLASSGTVDITGSSAITLSDITLSGTGALSIVGTASNTLGDVTLSSAATTQNAVSGTSEVTLEDVLVASAGTVLITGSSAITLEAITVASAGTLSIAGSASNTLGEVLSAGAGTLDIVGTASNTLGEFTLSSTGGTQNAVTGDASITIGDLTVASAGSLSIVGSASNTLGDVTGSATGSLDITGSASNTLGETVLASSGTLGAALITGSASINLEAMTLASAGVLPISGSLTTSLSLFSIQSTGGVEIIGNADLTLGSVFVSTTGRVGGMSALSPTQATKLREIWQALGLDPENPLTVTRTAKNFAGIELALTGDSSGITVERQ